MNKQEIINKVAQDAGINKATAKSAVDSVLNSIEEALVSGESVQFMGFGTFTTADRAARTAKVPGTDRTVDVPATTVGKFKVGKTLKLAIAGK